MCGLAAFFGNLSPEAVYGCIEKMLGAQAHRGPDSSGVWSGTKSGANIGVGLRRLKILDLSDSANQPMLSGDNRFVLVFNGEIYNYLELRARLAASGVCFRTNGDTEVLLQALIKWGPDAFAQLNGMWALVLVDLMSGRVMLSRDRFGIKPLYTYWDERGLYISSEIKAILEVTGKKFCVSPNVANAFLNQNLLSISRQTFFEGIEEFPPAHWAVMDLCQLNKKSLHVSRYWSVSQDRRDYVSENDLLEVLRDTFMDSVKLRLRSDVPVGVLLSGGLDSSAIAGVLHHLNAKGRNITLISAVAPNGADEQPFIDATASHIKHGVEKVILDYSPSDALDLISEVSWFNDEPIYNFSIVAHYLLMVRARELGITVLLSGQGADEILCGYKKYLGFYIQELLQHGKLLMAAEVAASSFKRKTILPQVTYQEAKRYLPRWLHLPDIDIRGPAIKDISEWVSLGLNGGRVMDRQIADLEQFSVPGIVHYEDRMSMAMGREIRLPYLDYRLVNLIVPLPVDLKIRDGWTKWIFRKTMEPFLPKNIVWRKDKQNFTVPQNEWFRHQLRDSVFRLLDSEWVTADLGLVSTKNFRKRYEVYLQQTNGIAEMSFKDIFSPIALELWARRFERHLSHA